MILGLRSRGLFSIVADTFKVHITGINRGRDYKTDLFIEEVTYCVGLQQENRFSLSAGLAVCVCLLHAKSLYISPAVSYLYLRNTFGPSQSCNFKTFTVICIIVRRLACL